jgi:peptidoglycan hydrolase-like protein with peptidoglycan-binding domain
MLSRLLALSSRAVVITLVASVVVLGVPATVATAAPAHKSSTASSELLLYEGVGMGARPSKRVKRMQSILQRRGFSVGPPGVDGRFGPLTAGAVRRLQSTYGLTPDAIVGPKTRRVVARVAESQRARREPAHNKPGKTPRATSPTPSAQPPATSARPDTRPTADRSQTPAADTARTKSDNSIVPTLLAGIAVLLSATALLVALFRRPRDKGQYILSPHLRLEGHNAVDQVWTSGGSAPATAPGDPAGAGQKTNSSVHEPRSVEPVSDNDLDVRPDRPPAGKAVPRSGEPVANNGPDVVGQLDRRPAGTAAMGDVTAARDAGVEDRSLMEIDWICREAGWDLRKVIQDVSTSRAGRSALARALDQIPPGTASAIVAGDILRVAALLGDLAEFLERLRQTKAADVVADPNVDSPSVQDGESDSTPVAAGASRRERFATARGNGAARAETADPQQGRVPSEPTRSTKQPPRSTKQPPRARKRTS